MSTLPISRIARIPLLALFISTGCTFPGGPFTGLGGDISGIFNQRWAGTAFQRTAVAKDWSRRIFRPPRISLRPVPRRPPVEPSQPDTSCRPSGSGTLSIESTGSFGALPTSTVELRSEEGVVAGGSVYTALRVPAGCPLDVEVTFLGLADDPTRSVEDLVVSRGNGIVSRAVAIETGMLRIRATSNGRRITGPARLHRVNSTTGRVEPSSSGTISANNISREISTGTYEVRLPYRGRTLSARVTVPAGRTRLVTLSE